MAEVKVKLVVTGTATTTLDYSIVNAPDDVAKEIAGLLADAKFDKITKDVVSPVTGKPKAHILLQAQGATVIDADLPIKKIAQIEKKLLHAMDLLLADHSA